MQVLQGVHYLHTKCGIIHTDIKPENILLTVDESYIRQLAYEANQWQKIGTKMPPSFVCTAPGELTTFTAGVPMSKNKKKRLKKKAKKAQAVLDRQLQELQQLDQSARLLNVNQPSLNTVMKSTSSHVIPPPPPPPSVSPSAAAATASITAVASVAVPSALIPPGGQVSPVPPHYNQLSNSSSWAASSLDASSHNGRHSKVSFHLGESGEGPYQSLSMLPPSSPNESKYLAAAPQSHALRRVASCPGQFALSFFSLLRPSTLDLVSFFSTENERSVSRRPDPSREVCDINVKIADLGNACWIVSH